MQCTDQQMSNLEHHSDQDITIKNIDMLEKQEPQVRRITEKDRELDLDTSEIEYKNRDHALFKAFAPYDKPKYAISVLVEHGGSGSSYL